MPLPSESGLATCSKSGAKDIFNLWVEFVTDHTLEEPPKGKAALGADAPNIVVFFVDSLAAARLSREMPKTKEVLLQAQRGEFKSHAAFQFKRFNVVGLVEREGVSRGWWG